MARRLRQHEADEIRVKAARGALPGDLAAQYNCKPTVVEQILAGLIYKPRSVVQPPLPVAGVGKGDFVVSLSERTASGLSVLSASHGTTPQEVADTILANGVAAGMAQLAADWVTAPEEG